MGGVLAEVVHGQGMQPLVFDLKVIAAIDGGAQPDAFHTLHDHLGALVAFLDPVDGGDGAHREKIVPARVFDGGLLLRHGDDAAPGVDPGVHRRQRLWPPDRQGNDDLRVDHRVFERQYGIGFGHEKRLHFC